MQRFVAAALCLTLGVVLAACQAGGPSARIEAAAPAAPAARADTGAPAGPAPAAAAAAAPATAPASPAAPTRVVFSFSNLTPNQWPLWIAQDQGLFARRGLDVDVRLIESSTGVPALIAGEMQAAVLGGSEVLSAATEGAELMMVAGLSQTYAFRFMAPESIRTPEDLRGKRVGVSRIGSSSDIATRLALQRLGLVPNQDVEVVQVGSLTARIQALESGAIQGGVTEMPDTMRLGKMGYHVVFDLTDLGLLAATDVVALRRAYLAEQRATAQVLVDAIVEGIAVQRQDRAAAEVVLGRWLQNDDPEALAQTWEFYTSKLTARVPRISPEQFTDARAVLAEHNPRLADYDVSPLLDNSFVDAAVARGLAGPQ